MPLDVNIKNVDTGRTAFVDKGGKLRVQSSDIPQNGQEMLTEPFREFMTNSSNSSDMRVDGSSTNVDFDISSETNEDKYVVALSVALVDTNATLDKFGNLSALTNGVRFALKQDKGDQVFHSGIKTNFQFMRLALGNPPTGSDTSAFRVKNAVGTAEAYIPFIDLRILHGLPYGIRIPRNTTTTLTMTVRDDLSSGLDQFDIAASGFLRLDERDVQ